MIGKTYTAADGTPADPAAYGYQRAARNVLQFAALFDRFIQTCAVSLATTSGTSLWSRGGDSRMARWLAIGGRRVLAATYLDAPLLHREGSDADPFVAQHHDGTRVQVFSHLVEVGVDDDCLLSCPASGQAPDEEH
jgi:hypothetical protein